MDVGLKLPALAVLALAATVPASAENQRAEPSGFDEVPTLSSPARANFNARINQTDTEIGYVLGYTGFTTPVLQAHLHLGTPGVNGGIMVFLCTNLGNGPPGTPECPTPEGTVTGVLSALSVVGPSAQGIAAGEFAKVIEAIRSGAAYANIHTEKHPGGELRGPVSRDLGAPPARG